MPSPSQSWDGVAIADGFENVSARSPSPSLVNPDKIAIEDLAGYSRCKGLFVPKAASPYIRDVTGVIGDSDWSTVPTGARSFYDDGDLWVWGTAVSPKDSVAHLRITGPLTIAWLGAIRTASTSGIVSCQPAVATEDEVDNILYQLVVPTTTSIRYLCEYNAGVNVSRDYTVSGTDLPTFFDEGPRLHVYTRDSDGNGHYRVDGVEVEPKSTNFSPPTGGGNCQISVGVAGPWRMLLIDDEEADSSRLEEIHAAVGMEVS
jgi:hypothetical protein